MSSRTQRVHVGPSRRVESAPSSSQDALSSPSRSALRADESTKPNKRPSVTPNTFRRFFTPRSSMRPTSGARRALQDITRPANNRRQMSSSKGRNVLEPFQDVVTRGDENIDAITTVQGKRRKILHLQGSASRGQPLLQQDPLDEPVEALEGSRDLNGAICSTSGVDDDELLGEDEFVQPLQLQPLRRWQPSSLSARLLERSLDFCRARRDPFYAASRLNETMNFYSGPSDVHTCSSEDGSEAVVPFCVASCNTNSLVAVGDEAGGVRLLESAHGGKDSFESPYLAFQPHSNAILDLAFSSDDLLLATASGDQTVHIIDMLTQRTICALAGHVSSVKQVRFQPGGGSNSVVATSSRDGSIQIWDLRCKGIEAPDRQPVVHLESGAGEDGQITPQKINWARPVGIIPDAHADRGPTGAGQGSGSSKPLTMSNPASKGDSPLRRGDVSVTSLAFLPPGREHLLLSASEANASIKLWDLRRPHKYRRNRATPLSVAQQPDHHERYRAVGVNSLAISGDGARLYSLCRDNTIYAYSTNHLILGHAPELSRTTSTATHIRRSNYATKEGLGPLYGFRHQDLHSSSFYVKMSLRRATGDRAELLAVGSGDSCAVLFPTDERFLSSPTSEVLSSTTPTSRSNITANNDAIPIYGSHGTPLIRGHSREVTSVSWTSEGELVTVGDDYTARCWRQGSEARELRRGGEGEGRRWRCGWADGVVDDDDDDDDDDEGEEDDE